MFVKSNNIRVQIKRSYVENKLNLCKAYNKLVFAKFYARAFWKSSWAELFSQKLKPKPSQA